jgi:hypothetical protein
MKEIRTVNGKHDARCKTCLGAVYRLWVTDDAPPAGCCEGHDSEPWKCGHIYNRLVSVVIREDHIKKPLEPEQEYLLALLGPKAAEIMSDIRAQKWPPRYNSKPKEPDYSTLRSVQ